MNFRELVESWRKILQISSKPTREEYLAILKVTFIGLTAIGVVAFIIRIIFYSLLFPYTG
ncbi:MAG: protein translocase SEC61 complex subunit gamma [Desulfurococcaceae archaeon]